MTEQQQPADDEPTQGTGNFEVRKPTPWNWTWLRPESMPNAIIMRCHTAVGDIDLWLDKAGMARFVTEAEEQLAKLSSLVIPTVDISKLGKMFGAS